MLTAVLFKALSERVDSLLYVFIFCLNSFFKSLKPLFLCSLVNAKCLLFFQYMRKCLLLLIEQGKGIARKLIFGCYKYITFYTVGKPVGFPLNGAKFARKIYLGVEQQSP